MSSSPLVMTGPSLNLVQWMPSGEPNAHSPLLPAFLQECERLVTGIGAAGRVLIFEGSEQPVQNGPAIDDDVVSGRPAELDQPQLRSCPLDAVLALGVADVLPPGTGEAAFVVDKLLSPVVHAVEAIVAQDGEAPTGIALPRGVQTQRNFPGDGSMQKQGRAAPQACNQVVVDKGLKTGADVKRDRVVLAGRSYRRLSTAAGHALGNWSA